LDYFKVASVFFAVIVVVAVVVVLVIVIFVAVVVVVIVVITKPRFSFKFRGHWSGGTRSGRGQLFASNGSLIYDGEVAGDLKTGTGNDFIDGKIYYAGQFDGQLIFVIQSSSKFWKRQGQIF
jgi:hypothetical protein